jgi:hypothetical protein
MNKRIQKLLTPKLKEWGGGLGDNFSEELEKFAELIVQECVGIADHSNITGKSIIGQRIKEHFGVEE